jgi:hypothetical protein
LDDEAEGFEKGGIRQKVSQFLPRSFHRVLPRVQCAFPVRLPRAGRCAAAAARVNRSGR